MTNIFTKHPHSIDESYFQHLRFAMQFGGTMLIGGLACCIHAVFPFLFEKTGSNLLLKLTRHFVDRMPEVEARVMAISEVIDKKCNQRREP